MIFRGVPRDLRILIRQKINCQTFSRTFDYILSSDFRVQTFARERLAVDFLVRRSRVVVHGSGAPFTPCRHSLVHTIQATVGLYWPGPVKEPRIIEVLMAHLITRFISRSTYLVVLKNSVGTLLYSLSLFLSTGASKDPGPVS